MALGHITDANVPARFVAKNMDLARSGIHRPGDDVEKRAFAGAIGAEHGKNFPFLDFQGQPVQCINAVEVECFDVGDAQQGGGRVCWVH